jgi:hypothetical protein
MTRIASRLAALEELAGGKDEALAMGLRQLPGALPYLTEPVR